MAIGPTMMAWINIKLTLLHMRLVMSGIHEMVQQNIYVCAETSQLNS